MYVLSKLLNLLAQPLAWVVVLLGLALLVQRRWSQRARQMQWLALGLLLLVGWLPLPNALLWSLENQYPEIAPQADLSGYVGVVVLGGATESGYLAQAHPQPLLGGAAERMTAPVSMRLRNPHLRLIFTGGEGELVGSGPSEAIRAQGFFESMGLLAGQVQYESVSRNTFENAVLTARLPGVDITQPWLLVTSASHMPRSMATFAKAGWNVTAYPVDFRSAPQAPWNEYSLWQGAERWQLALHERLGLLAYRLTGRL